MTIPLVERFPRLEQAGNALQTTLSGAIGTAARPVTVTPASTAGWPTSPGFRVLIDSEYLVITYVGTSTWIAETADGSTSATHSSGATVTQVLTWGGIQQLFADHSGSRGQAGDPHPEYVRRDEGRGGRRGLSLVDTGATNIADFGTLDGSDDTTSIRDAINACPDGGVVYFPPQTAAGAAAVYNISTIPLPNKRLTFWMYGATINCTQRNQYAFTQANRQRLTMKGGTFTGSGGALWYQLAQYGVQSYDLSIEDCNFQLPADQTALFLAGVREATITNCWFDNCTGMLLTETVNTHIVGCQFRNCTKGIYGQGTPSGDAFNAGMMVQNSTFLGCGYAIQAVAWDWVSIMNCMIDYNDHCVQLTNVDTAAIMGSYLSARETATTLSPTIEIGTDATQAGGTMQHVNIVGNQILVHTTNFPELAVGIKIGGVDWCSISNNDLHFWKKYAIQVTSISTYLTITGNRMLHDASGTQATSPSTISGTSGNDSTWTVRDNYLELAMLNVAFAIVRDNTPPQSPTIAAVSGATGAGTTPPAPVVGSANDWRGTITFGTGTTTVGTGAYVTVTFARAYGTIPSVTVTPANQVTAVKQPYVTNIQSTSFQIGLGVAGAVSQANTVYSVSYQVVV